MGKKRLGEISPKNLNYLRIANIMSFAVFNGFFLGTHNIEMILITLGVTVFLTIMNFYYSYFKEINLKQKLEELERKEAERSELE